MTFAEAESLMTRGLLPISAATASVDLMTLGRITVQRNLIRNAFIFYSRLYREWSFTSRLGNDEPTDEFIYKSRMTRIISFVCHIGYYQPHVQPNLGDYDKDKWR